MRAPYKNPTNDNQIRGHNIFTGLLAVICLAHMIAGSLMMVYASWGLVGVLLNLYLDPMPHIYGSALMGGTGILMAVGSYSFASILLKAFCQKS